MKTAEEILKQVIETRLSGATRKMRLLSDKSIEIEAMKAYALEACKEQRRICFDEAELDTDEEGDAFIIVKSITQAPSPELK